MGSFFYTLSLRYINPEFDENRIAILYKSSHCPSCQKKIKPIFLIPVFGYLFTMGKCHYCRQKISIKYFIAEIFAGLLSLSVYFYNGLSIESVFIYLIFSLAITLSIIDFKTFKIPNLFVIIILLLSVYPVLQQGDYKNNVYGFLLFLILFGLIMFVLPGGIGAGDVKYSASIGWLLGLELGIVAIETALITATLYGLIFMLIKKSGIKFKIPFAPFLTVGMIFSYFYGSRIILYYYRFFF